MKNKLIVTFFLLILCAGSVTTALKSFDNVQNNIATAKKIQTARLEAAKVTPTPTPEPVDPAIPVLTLTSDTIEITAGSSFSVISPVADITDDKDDRSSLFRNIHVTGDYNLYTPGQYTLQYVATDSDGHTSLPETLTLIVK